MKIVTSRKNRQPERAAKQFESLAAAYLERLPEKSRAFLPKLATAFVYGASDWKELQLHRDTALDAELSLLDEELKPDQLCERRQFQVGALGQAFQTVGLTVDKAKLGVLIATWQPSARRPKESATVTVDAEAWEAGGHRESFVRLYRNLERSGRRPTQGEVQELVNGMRCADPMLRELVGTFLGPLAVRLINDDGQSDANEKLGLLLFEALIAHGNNVAKLDLAETLVGAESTKQLKRVGELLKTINRTDFILDETGRRLEWTKATYLFKLGGKSNRQKALRVYEKLAPLDPRSAYLAGIFYDSERPEGFGDTVPIDLTKAKAFFEMGFSSGHGNSLLPLIGVLIKLKALHYVEPNSGLSAEFLDAYDAAAKSILMGVDARMPKVPTEQRALGFLYGAVRGSNMREAAPKAAVRYFNYAGAFLGFSLIQLEKLYHAETSEFLTLLHEGFTSANPLYHKTGTVA